MEEARAHFADMETIGAVLFARTADVPDWITPLFRMTQERT